MQYDNMINEYFDGNLDSTNQEFLFAEMAKNEDMRYDFNQQFAMKMAIGKDTAAFVPRTETTDALFSTLGIAGASATKLGFLATNKKQIFTGFFTTLATVLIMLWLLPLGDSSLEISRNEIPVISSYDVNLSVLTIEVPKEENNEAVPILPSPNKNAMLNLYHQEQYLYLSNEVADLNSQLLAAKSENQRIMNENNNLKSSLIDITTQPTVSNEQKDIYADENYSTVFQSNFVEIPNNLNTNTSTNFTINNNVAYNPETSIKLEAAVGRYFQALGTDFIERNNTFSDNLRVSGLYNLSREYSIGVDMRQENFYQEFTDVNDQGNKVLYQQQPV